MLVGDSDGLPLYIHRGSKFPGKRFYMRSCHFLRSRSFSTKFLLFFVVAATTFSVFTFLSDSHSQTNKESVQLADNIAAEQFDARNSENDVDNEKSLKKAKVENDIPQPVEKEIPHFSGPQNERQRAVVKAFQHSWSGYKLYAWGHDQLKPVSKSYSDWFDTGLTIVDSIDTAIIMGLKKETQEATTWIRNHLSFDKDRFVNLFETTIRVLGGLLSAFHLTGEKMFVEKAVDLGDRLLAGFTKSKSAVPLSDVNLLKRTAKSPQWSSESSLSEITSLQLEFRDLSRVTGNNTYEKIAFAVSEHVHKLGCAEHNGLCGMFLDSYTGQFKKSTTITFGARADSYYEYLFKQWQQTGKSIEWLKDDYAQAMDSMKEKLWRPAGSNKMWFIGELLSGQTFSPKMDHLVCFLAGTLALGTEHGFPKEHLDMAEKLGETCQNMYINPTGLGPEIAHFNMIPGKEDMYIKPLDAHSLLRPEAFEAWFYLYRLTGDKKYQEWGWSAFQAIEKYARIATGGYSSVSNVKRIPVTYRDLMESFYTAESLKYLYLLFADDQSDIPLSKWVFNTEAHPLPVYSH